MASYRIEFYSTNPDVIPRDTGDSFVWTGSATRDGVALITDTESGVEGITLDDDSDGNETATANVTIGGQSSTASSVDAERVWTLRDSVTGDTFQVAEFDVETGDASGDYTLSELPLVPGRSYEVLEYNDNPDASVGDIAFNYLDYAANNPNVVSGTSGDDRIDASYTGDPEGDRVDDGTGNDASGLGDVIEAGGGNDVIQGGAGDDTIYGDNPEAERLVWTGAGPDDSNLAAGVTQTTGATTVNVTFQPGSGNNSPLYEVNANSSGTEATYTEAGEPFDPNSSLYLFGTGAGETSITRIAFDDATGGGPTGVQNLSFRINDIDAFANNHIDVVTINAFDADGNPVAVTITPAGNDTVAGNTITAAMTLDDEGDAAGSALIEIAGPVARIDITYENAETPSDGYTGTQAIFVSDLHFEALPAGDDTIEGGAGDDALYGGDGDDLFRFDDGFGNDTVEGGAGTDTLDFSAMDTAITGGFSGDGAGSLGDGSNSAAFDGIEAVVLTGQNDSVDASATTQGIALSGLGGDDTLIGGSGDDLLYGDGTAPAPAGGAWTYTAYDYDFSSADGQAFDMEAGTVAGSGTTDSFDVEGLINTVRGTSGNPEDFGIVLRSTLTPIETGTYDLSLTSDDGSTLQIFDADGNPVDVVNGDGSVRPYLDNDYHQAATTRTGEVELIAGQSYTIEIRYWENGGGNVLDGTITPPSGTTTPLATSPLISAPTPPEGAGNDSVIGGAGADTLIGGAGNDTLVVAEGDSASGGDGDDYFLVTDYGESGAGTIDIDGGETDETLGDTLDFNGQLLLGSLSYSETDDSAGGLSGTAQLLDGTVVNFTGIETIICFTLGTRILTPHGERPVETLRPGDMVITADHGPQPLRWIGQRTVRAEGRLAPVRIRAGLFGNRRDLLVSPQHRVLYEGYRAQMLFGENQVLVPATHLVDHHQILEEPGGEVTYLHLMFDRHELVFAEGARSESFHPGHVGLDAIRAPAREELFEIFPELRANPRDYGPTSRMCLKRIEARMLDVA